MALPAPKPWQRSTPTLGRLAPPAFGPGLKTASISQRRRVVVATLKSGELSVAVWAQHGLPDQEMNALLRGHRSTHLRLRGMLIRDQVPMPPAALAPALDDGMKPGDWYALINEHVFFWPDRERLDRHLKACGSRPQYLMTFDAAELFNDLGDEAYVSPINSGNARRKPVRRGRDTFVPYRTWIEHGWPSGQRSRPPAEFLFRCDVPVTPPYLINLERLLQSTAGRPFNELFGTGSANKERTSMTRSPLEIVKELYAN